MRRLLRSVKRIILICLLEKEKLENELAAEKAKEPRLSMSLFVSNLPITYS